MSGAHRRRSRGTRLAIAALVLVVMVGTAGAQEIRVARSSGSAEILIPDAGWRQAVSGRLFPVRGSLATWVGGSVAFEWPGTDVALGALTIVELIGADAILELRLVAGSVTVRAGDAQVVVHTPAGTIVAANATFAYADSRVSVTAGEIAVTAGGTDARRIAAPAEVSLGPLPVRPVLGGR